ncbi:MAG TPA: c-type cytochrome [Vicinamibacteria bacterium]|nr:c-type cytochrome [Vicinamibacteria bacterium]
MRGTGRVLVAAAMVAAAGMVAAAWRERPHPSRVQRGWEVASAKGCFTCHGPGGIRGMADPGHGLDEVPPFSGGLITMYARSEEEIREWILDGLPRRIREDPEQMKLREAAIIRMPAWRRHLTSRELDDLVAFVKAVSDFETPDDPDASEGREVANRLGCFNCHGPQGRGTMSNPGAFKRYIPAWDGPDFAELARDDDEVREWILDGRPRRLEEDRLARFFLDRQVIDMPAYRGHVSAEEVDRLVDYIRWVRRHPY